MKIASTDQCGGNMEFIETIGCCTAMGAILGIFGLSYYFGRALSLGYEGDRGRAEAMIRRGWRTCLGFFVIGVLIGMLKWGFEKGAEYGMDPFMCWLVAMVGAIIAHVVGYCQECWRT